MTEPFDPELLVREAQIGAAIGALGLEGSVFRPLIGAFGPELVRHVVWTVPGDLDRLRVTTRIAGEHGVRLLTELLSSVYETSEDLSAWVGEVGTLLGQPTVTFGIETTDRPGEPVVRVGWLRTDNASEPWNRKRIELVLNLLGVSGTVRTALDRLYGKLHLDEAVEIAVSQSPGDEEPLIELTTAMWSSSEDRAAVLGGITNTAAALGVSDAQQAWLGKIVGALISDVPLTDTQVTLSLRRDRVLSQLRVDVPMVAAPHALRLLTQLHPEPARPTGATLGALVGALGGGDAVSRLGLTVWDGQMPRARFELRSDG